VKLTLAQAAKEVGKDRSTIFRAIKKGTISAEKDEVRGYVIEPSELFRVYPPKVEEEITHKGVDAAMQHHAYENEIKRLEAHNNSLHEELKDAKADKAWYQDTLQKEREEREKLQARLSYQLQTQAPANVQPLQAKQSENPRLWLIALLLAAVAGLIGFLVFQQH
jgi:IS30 family transposase